MKLTLKLLVIVFGSLAASSASALTEVWVAARSEVIFDQDGRIAALRHAWEFDELYSAILAVGRGKKAPPLGSADLAPGTKDALLSLKELEYFTFAEHGDTKMRFRDPEDVTIETDAKGVVTLRFTLPLETPIVPRQPFSFQVYDPTYVVSLGFEKRDPVTMNRAPIGCSLKLLEPKPLITAFGTLSAANVTVACP